MRDVPDAFGGAAPILKLDVTTVTVGGDYPLTEYVAAYTVDDARRVGAAAVLTFVQLGADFELDALRTAGQVAAASDRAGLPYVCEIMPVESARFPDPYDPVAIAAATRTAVELGAHVVKTSMPTPPEAVADAAAFGVPVIIAGGELTSDRDSLVRCRRRGDAQRSERRGVRQERLGRGGPCRHRERAGAHRARIVDATPFLGDPVTTRGRRAPP